MALFACKVGGSEGSMDGYIPVFTSGTYLASDSPSSAFTTNHAVKEGDLVMFSGYPAASFGNARLNNSDFTDVTNDYSLETGYVYNTKIFRCDVDVSQFSWVFNVSYGSAISTILRPVRNIQ